MRAAVGSGICCGSTLRADPIQIEVMGDLGIAVSANEIGRVVFDRGEGESDGPAAPSAQQVMAMFWRSAQPVEDLPALCPLSFDDPVVGEGAQDAVDTGQSDANWPFATDVRIELLSTAKPVAAAQHLQDHLPLGGVASPLRCQGCAHREASKVMPVRQLTGRQRSDRPHGTSAIT
jgi:hypothetical protein